MKYIAHFLFFTSMIFTSCENSDEVGKAEFVLSSETQYVHAGNGIDTVTSYYFYDQEKLIRMEAFIPQNELPFATLEFFYDENNHLINGHAVSFSRIDRAKFQENYYSYEYNEDGIVASEITDSLIQYYGGPITIPNAYRKDYQYDEQLRLISIHIKDRTSDFHITKFYYDSHSNLIKEENYSEASNTAPTSIIEFKSFDTHPNPFYSFMNSVQIPYYNVGYCYSSYNVLEAESLLLINSQKNKNTYTYEYGSDHDLPLKIYKNGKLWYELTYERVN